MTTTKAVRVSLLDDDARVESLTVLSRFRTDFYACLPARADTLQQLESQSPEYRKQIAEFLDSLVGHYVLDGGRLTSHFRVVQ